MKTNNSFLIAVSVMFALALIISCGESGSLDTNREHAERGLL
jgi:hypothetical protein